MFLFLVILTGPNDLYSLYLGNYIKYIKKI